MNEKEKEFLQTLDKELFTLLEKAPSRETRKVVDSLIDEFFNLTVDISYNE